MRLTVPLAALAALPAAAQSDVVPRDLVSPEAVIRTAYEAAADRHSQTCTTDVRTRVLAAASRAGPPWPG